MGWATLYLCGLISRTFFYLYICYEDYLIGRRGFATIRNCTHLLKYVLNEIFLYAKNLTFFLQFSFFHLIYFLGGYNLNKKPAPDDH